MVTRDFVENEARAQTTPHGGAALLRDLKESGLPHTPLLCSMLPYPSATLKPSLRQRVGMLCSARCRFEFVILSQL